MRRESSPNRLLKLESLRGFASLYVVVFHSQFSKWGWLPIFLGHGEAAVVLFFLLSGFVIHYSTCRSGRPLEFADYLRRRVRRIYPIFLCALLIAYLSQCLIHQQILPVPKANLLGNLAMLADSNKPGIWVEPFMVDIPIWSLSYEWWFYLLFFALLRCFSKSPLKQQIAAAGITLFGIASTRFFPNQISLFMGSFWQWWAGVELSRQFLEEGEITWQRQFPSLLILGLMILLWWVPGVSRNNAMAALLILSAGLIWNRLRFVGFQWVLGGFVIVAPISYALYLTHLPLIFLFGSRALQEIGALKYFAIPLLLFSVAYLLEVVLQPFFNAVVDQAFSIFAPRLRPSIDRYQATADPSTAGR